MKLSILIPVFNERLLLPELLLLLPPALPGVEAEVILVDDGSTDGTREWIAETLTGANGPVEPYGRIPITVVLHERNQGKGAAIRTAIRAASGDAMVIQDADLEYDPADLMPMWRLIESGRADVVYGSRFYGRPHRCLYFHHYFANKLISMLFSVLYNQILSDLEVCYKMFRREVLQYLSLRSDDFGFEIEFSANVARAAPAHLRGRHLLFRPHLCRGEEDLVEGRREGALVYLPFPLRVRSANAGSTR